MSVALTTPLPLVSPMSIFTLTGVSGRTWENSSVTPLKVTVSVCALATPVKLTVMVLPEKIGVPETLPMPLVTLALPLVTLLVNVNTSV